MLQKEELINDLLEIAKLLDHIPSQAEYEGTGKYYSSTYKRKFGSWNNAILEAFNITRPVRKKRTLNSCLKCETKTKNNKFCSQKCAASFNNQVSNGRKIGRKRKVKICKRCGKQEIPTRKLCCDNCKFLIKTNDGYKYFNQVTKSMIATNDTQKYRRIRNHARVIAKDAGLLNKCHECGYSLHVECCHLKGINSFPDSALVSEINAISNLLGFCGNHHWEFDHGCLKI